MCGIFGAVHRTAVFDQDQVSDFKRACNIIAHRGPDAEGFFSTHTRDEEGAVNLFLGHRRLSIIDLDPASNQPFSRDGLHMVYNGEVFNYQELRSGELGDVAFATQGDTEVVLRAYQKWGASCFGKFNGMWALAIYDAPRQKLVLARDRFSIKPLYLMRANGALFFASEIKQLKQISGLSFSPNTTIIHAFLNQGLLDHRPETFYNEVQRFPAMHALEIDLRTGEESWTQYWDYAPEEVADSVLNPAERFRELLIDALKLRLRSDVPVGTLLSGGLDSSAISCLIQAHIKPDVSTFSVVSPDPRYSEERYIDLLVKEKGLRNEKLRFDRSLALDHVQAVLQIQDEPYGSLSVVAQHLLFQQIKQATGITVLLSGQGADEVLLGYNKFFYFHLKSLLKRRKILDFIGLSAASFLKGTTIREFDLREAKRYLPGSNRRGQSFLEGDFESESLWAFDNMRKRQILDIDRYSVPALTHYEDRNSMASSIEVRLPFLDYRIVNFLINQPTERKLKSGWTKHLLRTAVTELPEDIRWRKDKKGFSTPEAAWMKGELGAHIGDYMLKNSMLAELGLLNQPAFLKALALYRKGDAWLSYGDLFRVYITELWLREHI